MGEGEGPGKGPQTQLNHHDDNTNPSSSGNVVSLTAYRVGMRLIHPRDAVLPWMLRLAALSLARRDGLPYDAVLRDVCKGYARRAV